MSDRKPGPLKIILSILMVFICVYALAWCGDVRAAGANVTFMTGFVSEHIGSGISGTTGKPYQENNVGFGIRVDEGPLYGWMVGTYRNSHNKQSLYIAKEWKTSRVGPFQLGLIAGGITGYNTLVLPAVLPEFIINMWRAELVFLAQPFKVGSSTPMVAAQLRWRFW